MRDGKYGMHRGRVCVLRDRIGENIRLAKKSQLYIREIM